MSEPLPSASNGRTPTGTFAAGNAYGKGNPNLRKMHALRAAMLDAVTPEKMHGIVGKLVGLAEGGDLEATKILLAYTVGKPPASIALTGADGEPLGADMAEVEAAILTALKPFGESARFSVAMALRGLVDARDAGAAGDPA